MTPPPRTHRWDKTVSSTHRPPRGALVSIEGLNGVGKTYLTSRIIEATSNTLRTPACSPTIDCPQAGPSPLTR